MYIRVFQYLYSLHFYKYFILYIHISPQIFLRILRLVYIKFKSLFIPKNIYVFLCALKYYSYLCSVESNQITAGCLNKKVLSLLHVQTFPFQ